MWLDAGSSSCYRQGGSGCCLTRGCSWQARNAPGSARGLLAGGDQRTVEFGSAGMSPAAEPQGR